MTRRRDHLPSRPTWRCRACGIAWPCSPAKLRLLAEYRNDRPALLVHLATLRAQAAVHLDESNSTAELVSRLTDQATAR
ncbi:flavin reductase [Micromonospora sp. ALFpr18c]|uniref:flavin reductase n=1 Tax=unclassified Micromonospora TaxID=2617518 RepID=UPI00124BA30A|nr:MULTISPECIES: flavin reductase [unclassified Micromonospora]KAB1947209.1 flavin reductase [Micromonospora sp. ALFpr18c]MDG4758412.1 flavin reductase [Micromonospora sp. WMMD710]